MLSNKVCQENLSPLVHDADGIRALEFQRGSIQSAMDLRDPLRLVLGYTRAIMLFSLFVPRPRHLLFVGLGGGSLVKFCYHCFPEARLTVIEKRADVIALRSAFAIPPDDARLQVVLGDASTCLHAYRDSVDVLILDGFDAAGLPLALCHPRFYADCVRALRQGGLLVKNVFSYDKILPLVLSRLRLMFHERVCSFRDVAGNNVIVFAVKQEKARPLSRAARLARLIGWNGGLGHGWLNRRLVAWVVWRLRRR